MRPRRLLRLLSDFDGKIRYHPRKASVTTDALSRNERVKPLRVRALVMTINSYLPPQIHEAQVEALKKENIKDENLHGKVMLKASPWEGVIRFSKRGKLNPRYIRSFKILAKVGMLAYLLQLPEQLSRIDDKLNFIEEPVKIMDREVKRLKQSRITIVKVRWNSRQGLEFTWECEDQMKKKYPHLFVNP
ncbi:hypothetical protein Tco_1410757 [Tanacetum coccineum]